MNFQDLVIPLQRSLIVLTPLALIACESVAEPDFVGTLERDRIELKVETNEPILSIHVIDGQRVNKGELILEQDPARAQARLAQQTAQYQKAAARMAELERGPREESIRENRAKLEGLQALTINTAAELHRAQEVFDKGLSNQATLDRAEARWKSALSQEEAARESLAALLHGTTIEELQQAAADLAVMQAMLDQVQLDLDRTRVFAPVSGVVDKLLFQIGERPAPGTTVAVVLDEARTFARVYIPEPSRAKVKPGKNFTVRIDGIDRDLQGTVRWVSSEASFTPYFALTEHDRSRLTYLAEIDLEAAADLPVGVPLLVLTSGD